MNEMPKVDALKTRFSRNIHFEIEECSKHNAKWQFQVKKGAKHNPDDPRSYCLMLRASKSTAERAGDCSNAGANAPKGGKVAAMLPGPIAKDHEPCPCCVTGAESNRCCAPIDIVDGKCDVNSCLLCLGHHANDRTFSAQKKIARSMQS